MSRPQPPHAPDAARRPADSEVRPHPIHAPHSVDNADAAEAAQELVRWQDLLGQVGREMAEPLTRALDRVIALTTSGRIDHQSLRTLREDIDRARHAGMLCQQMSRLASGRIRQSHERIHLTHTVQAVLAHRTRELQLRGLSLTQTMVPAEVQADPSMLFALLNHLVDWWLECAHGPIDLRLDIRTWPVHARLTCHFAAHAPDQAAQGEDVMLTRTSSLRWHLLEQTARSMGLPFHRQVRGHVMHLELEFPGTVNPQMTPWTPDAPDTDFGDSINSQPLAGCHVLLVAERRDLRQQAREALHGTGILLDVCTAVQEAVDFCQSGLPHAIVFASEMRNPLLARLIHHIRAEVPDFVFIEVTPQGRTFDISSLQASGIARVGGEDLAHALPSALVYELSRQH